MKTFPCIVRYDLEDDDDEAELLLIDTNITTRKDLDVISKAKVLKRKKDILDDKNYKTKIENLRKQAQSQENGEQIISAYNGLQNEFDMSKAHIQTLLRLNNLIPELQEKVRDNNINLKVGKQLSYLTNKTQKLISKMMLQNEKLKISETQAKKIKVMADEKEITKEDLESILLKNTKSDEEENKTFIIKFTSQELEILTNKLIEETKEITEENIKFKILDLLKFL